jgi:thiol-disulfide isomerase/thioredoxin
MKIIIASLLIYALYYTGTKQTNADNKIKIVADYSSINTIPQLLAHFKNKPVFIDLWATWCVPCVEEFSHSDSLYTFLSDKHIEMLYISIDENEQDSAWRATIQSHHLNGNHIRATKSLQEEINFLIWKIKDGYSIPHYILFDKNGTLLNKDLPKPDSGITLYNEIEKDMN